jgi:hypothetical protein
VAGAGAPGAQRHSAQQPDGGHAGVAHQDLQRPRGCAHPHQAVPGGQPSLRGPVNDCVPDLAGSNHQLDTKPTNGPLILAIHKPPTSVHLTTMLLWLTIP